MPGSAIEPSRFCVSICIGMSDHETGESTSCAYGGAYPWYDLRYSPPLPSEKTVATHVHTPSALAIPDVAGP